MFDVTVVNKRNVWTNLYISFMNDAERRVTPVDSDSSVMYPVIFFLYKLLL